MTMTPDVLEELDQNGFTGLELRTTLLTALRLDLRDALESDRLSLAAELHSLIERLSFSSAPHG